LCGLCQPWWESVLIYTVFFTSSNVGRNARKNLGPGTGEFLQDNVSGEFVSAASVCELCRRFLLTDTASSDETSPSFKSYIPLASSHNCVVRHDDCSYSFNVGCLVNFPKRLLANNLQRLLDSPAKLDIRI